MEIFSVIIGLAIIIGLYEYAVRSRISKSTKAIIGIFSALVLSASLIFPEDGVNSLNGIYEMASQNRVSFALTLLAFAFIFSKAAKKSGNEAN